MSTKSNRDSTGEVISSRNHAAIKRVRALSARAERERVGRFFIEGVRFLSEAAAAQAPIESVIYAPDLLHNPFARRLLASQHRAGVPCLPVSPEVLHSIAQNDDPQGIGAVVRQSWKPLARARPNKGLCWIALDEIQSPGNLGTIIRTADAVGASGLIFIGDSIDPYDAACVRASMGALFAQDFVRATPQEFQDWKHKNNCVLIGTSPSASESYDAMQYGEPLVLWMGWERKGLSREQQGLCDAMVSIPMSGRADSLNLAVATGVMLYEVLRQKRARPAQVLVAGQIQSPM